MTPPPYAHTVSGLMRWQINGEASCHHPRVRYFALPCPSTSTYVMSSGVGCAMTSDLACAIRLSTYRFSQLKTDLSTVSANLCLYMPIGMRTSPPANFMGGDLWVATGLLAGC